LPPNILEVTDASQLLGLVAARDAFEDAGYGQNSEKFTKALKEKTGVLLGVGGGQKLITPLISRLQYPIWERALRASGISEEDIPKIVAKMKSAYVGWNENAFPGLLGNVISGRITNRFDLGGINSVVDAACAASLSAIKMALSELVEGRCDMMLTGGVDTDNSPLMYMSFSKTPAFSKSGNISPFGDAADGMLIGEGLGMLVLKRLEDAERDNDRIYGVIKGVGTSSDGRFKSVYAPRPAGQALAMNRAYEDAGYSADTVGLLEGHGTGTGAGDPTEFTSMQMVFGANNPRKQHIALGSVKSQIGHTKSAAGAAGIIKAILALHHKVLPPTINVAKPNAKFNIEDSALYINTEARPWMQNGHPRRSGVSAFGFGGINVHITIEEYQGVGSRDYRMHEPYKTVILQASNPAELLQLGNEVLSKLRGAESETAFKELIAESKNSQLNQHHARVGFVATSIQDCIELLETARTQGFSSSSWDHPKGIYYQPKGIDVTTNKVVALFAGQGSQYVGMGKELANAFPTVTKTFEQADKLFKITGSSPLSNCIFPIPVFSKEERAQQQVELTKTQFAQPAIGVLSMGQFKTLQQAGFAPQFTAGHSFGELTALWAAGVYNDITFLKLAKTRGEVMAIDNPNSDAGTMLAVKAPEQQVADAIKNISGVTIANVNSNQQVVLGGSTAAIKLAEEQLEAQGFSVVPLPVAAAFHTEFVRHAQEPFSKFVDQQHFNTPAIPVYSNTTGKAYPTDLNELKSLLKNQILNPVLFKNQIENIYDAGGRVFVEFGPKGVLTNLVSNILEGKAHHVIAVNASATKDSDLLFRQATVQMQVLGLPLSNIDPYKKEMIPLPPKSKLTVALSGNNYVSEPTQKAHQDLMNDGFKITGGGTEIIEKIITIEKIVEVPVQHATPSPSENEEETMNKEVFQLLQITLDSFKANQTKALEIFERFMDQQNQQSQQLLTILSQNMSGGNSNMAQAPLVSTGLNAVAPAASFASNGSNGVSKAYASNGSNGHAAALKTAPAAPASNGKGLDLTKLNGHAPKAITVPTSPASNGKGLDLTKLTNSLLEVVSEKTGYPAEMLELSMDMEADLGIDSIKRVEIFGALTKLHPEMSGINPNELTELRTLAEIVSFVGAKSGALNGALVAETYQKTTAIPVPVIPIPAPVSPVSPASAHNPSSNGGMDVTKLTTSLLQVVSEKTGYPAEMLEISMDMEADLGIDSIKRVEIFGALTKLHPEMSGINPNELTELRTLAEIVSFVGAKSEASNGTVAAAAHQKVATIPAAVSPVAAAVSPVSANTPSATVGMDVTKLNASLLAVVSEKTGYPVEMLELSMDMEADLGIDSIKRVEIFGALTKLHPEMSGINPNELTELRTLAEIVSFVGAKSGASNGTVAAATPQKKTTIPVSVSPVEAPVSPIPANTPSSTSGMDVTKLTTALLQVVSEKTGYPAEMLELSMDMEADLGIDSIKRVEIFGALTKLHPEMSGINPNELTELRTLAEIVSFVGAKSGASNGTVAAATPQKKTTIPVSVSPVAAPVSSIPANTPSSTSGMDVTKLTTSLLQVVSEKTGYPAEMLELTMDMEADLGIDSIKRVEIFGALTKLHPEMSGINPNELTELRTLAEIVSFVGSKSVGSSGTVAAEAPQKVATIPASVSPNAAYNPSSSDGMDVTKLTTSLLQVVSEKTGYPAEMLELSMDMEADLGIDSIKRVEIFGALTKLHPEMSGINPNELTELRTLAEIVSFVGENVKKKVMA
jgi:acyl transferase domain-containing protein